MVLEAASVPEWMQFYKSMNHKVLHKPKNFDI